ncbi:MAG: YihY/virulence factor BrkB family protein [Gammaproteobacteria bacterium]
MARSVSEAAKAAVDRVCEYPVIGLLVRAGLKGHQDGAKDMAASMAFFSFLSLFPLLLGLVALGGYFLKSEELQVKVHELIVNVFPISADFVTGNIDSLVRQRGAAGIVSILVLMWSASKMVGALSRGVNQALELKRPYAFYFSRLRNFGLTFTVAVVMFGAIAAAPAAEILANLRPGILGERWDVFFDVIGGQTVGLAITFLLLAIVYTLIPFERLKGAELLPGLLVASAAIEIGKGLFAFYYENVSSTDLVYGSVSSVIVLLLWLYFCSRVVLYGTEVICVYRQSRAAEMTDD